MSKIIDVIERNFDENVESKRQEIHETNEVSVPTLFDLLFQDKKIISIFCRE